MPRPGKLDKVVLETPDLTALNLSIVSVWRGGSCPGTGRGSTKIRCEWDNVNAGFYQFSDIKLTLDDYDPAYESALELPVTLTAYVNGAVVESTKQTLRWDRRALLRYTQSAPGLFEQPRVITISALPGAEAERQRLNQWLKFTDFQSTGFYLNPGSPLKVHVAGVLPGSGPLPRLLVGTPALVHPTIESETVPNQLEELAPMGNGEHTVSSNLGGILYIRYTGANPDSLPDITVTLENGEAAQPFPLFQEDITTDNQWKTMLTHTNVPFAEHSGQRVIITGLARDAKVWADRGQRQSTLFNLYREIIETQDRFSALYAASPDPKDRPSALGPMVVQTRRGANPTSSTYRVAIPRQRHDEIWGEYKLRRSWMMWHEFGHQRQQGPVWSWRAMTEITVNIYSLAVLRRSNPHAGRSHSEWEQAKNYLARPASEKNFDKLPQADFYVGLVMFEQLRVAFGGDSFYHRLHWEARHAPDQPSTADKRHFFMTRAAEIAKTDLTDYFTKWGLIPEERTVDEMRKQPKPNVDYTTRPVYGGK